MTLSTESQSIVGRDDPRPPAHRAERTAISKAELERMAKAAAEVAYYLRLLAKTRDNVVGDMLRGSETFYEWVHYPPHDVYDPETHAQYYYHTHPREQRPAGEHGHFHLFLRTKGMPERIDPAPIPGNTLPTADNDVASHIIGISMDRYGMPLRLFTTNRWVTGETWYAGDDVARMLDRYVVDVARPNWLINRWITAMVKLFRPQIVELIRARDDAIAKWRLAHPDVDVFEDRRLNVTSAKRINLQRQFDVIAKAIRHAKKNGSGNAG